MVQLNIPSSKTAVSVKMIDVSTIADVMTKSLFSPPIPASQTLNAAPSFVFLVEHPSGEKVLFDLGIRKDWHNLAPAITERLSRSSHRITVDKGIDEVLDEGGIDRKSIKAIIWSHGHWDHMGDPSLFPGSADLVVGPGFKNHYLAEGAQGNSPVGFVLPSDIEGREVHEITFTAGPQTTQIGRFAAHDYFGDGSFYLLDSPGHCIGHLCGLARTTAGGPQDDTFVFMGGDAAHHCSEFRPSAHVPMPEKITPNPLTQQDRHIPFCPGAWWEDIQTSRNRDPKGPLWQPAWGADMDQVLDTIGKMQECDGSANVLVILAHDSTLRAPEVPLFPQPINDWKARDLGAKLKWEWIADIMQSLQGGKAESA